MKSNREDLLTKLDDLHKSYMICESHFEDKMFTSHLHTRLVGSAYPTLFSSLEGSSKPRFEDHTYCAPLLLPAKIRVLDNRVLVPSSVLSDVTQTDSGI